MIPAIKLASGEQWFHQGLEGKEQLSHVVACHRTAIGDHMIGYSRCKRFYITWYNLSGWIGIIWKFNINLSIKLSPGYHPKLIMKVPVWYENHWESPIYNDTPISDNYLQTNHQPTFGCQTQLLSFNWTDPPRPFWPVCRSTFIFTLSISGNG